MGPADAAGLEPVGSLRFDGSTRFVVLTPKQTGLLHWFRRAAQASDGQLLDTYELADRGLGIIFKAQGNHLADVGQHLVEGVPLRIACTQLRHFADEPTVFITLNDDVQILSHKSPRSRCAGTSQRLRRDDSPAVPDSRTAMI